jgi:DNA-binding transcriptional MerR regulator
MPDKLLLPDKVYYSIGEIARYFGVSTSLIRYWEDEFPHLTPRKNGKGDRRYNKQDLEKVEVVYDLIKEKKFTIAGARAHLADKGDKKSQPLTVKQRLLEIRGFLLKLKEELSQFQ